MRGKKEGGNYSGGETLNRPFLPSKKGDKGKKKRKRILFDLIGILVFSSSLYHLR